MWTVVLFISLLGAVFSAPIDGVHTTEPFNNSVVLDTDGNYLLFWNFNSSHITFEVHVKTKGWVGFGLSDNGNMYPGDVVVGWVANDGTAHFADRHTRGRFMPIKDASQDWHLLHAEENDFGTVLKFVRLRETCDATEDIDIPAGTTRLIYSYGQSDPVSDDAITYHGPTHRGAKSVALLSTFPKPKNTPSDVTHFDFLNNNVLLSNASTTYYCSGFFLPDFGKHHMIQYEPVITPGNEKIVHHIVIYKCKANRTVSTNAHGECYGDRPDSFPDPCQTIFIAWAIGGQEFFFPDNVGFPVQAHGTDEFYLMETHYDNPTRKSGVIDNSGIRIRLTKQFRQHDAGLIELGVSVYSGQIVPPGEEAFISSGYCTETCVNEGFKQSNMQEIKVFGALQHSHLLGVGMTTRHYRNGTELKPIMDEPAYDFNFQEIRLLSEELSVYPGDAFTVDCRYDSRNRHGPTFGGLSTQDEMCLTFLYYYPAMKMESCVSLPLWDTYHLPIPMLMYKMRSMDWTDPAVVADFKQKFKDTKHYHMCRGYSLNDVDAEMFKEPVARKKYVPPPPKCTGK